jgi:hypothetical protein
MFLLKNLMLPWWDYLYVVCIFSLTPFNILSLFSVLAVLMIICHREFLFLSSLPGVLEAFCSWLGNSFLRCGKFSISLLTILQIPLPVTSYHWCPWFSGLIIWWSHWVLVYFFHSSWIAWLRVLLFFSLISILPLSAEILFYTCSSLLEWPSTAFLFD